MRAAGAALLALLMAGCATGNADWRREAEATTIVVLGAGDGRCSPPAPYTSLRACLVHDSAYELGRIYRDRPDPEGYSTEQARLVADLYLASQMAQDGMPEWWVWAYLTAVRLGGWWSWHVADP